MSQTRLPLCDGRRRRHAIVSRRRQQQRAPDRERAAEQFRDLVIVAAAVDGDDHAHPALLAEHVQSDHPLLSDPIRPAVLTHDQSGDNDDE